MTPDEWPSGAKVDVVIATASSITSAPTIVPDICGFVRQGLRPGGVFALWENNPWNPGTRLVMRRIPFDRNAVLLSARAAGLSAR